MPKSSSGKRIANTSTSDQAGEESKKSLDQAILLFKRGDTTRAFSILKALVKTNPGSSVAWYWLSRCYDITAKKIECLERAISLDPRNVKFQVELNKLTPHKKRQQKKPSQETTPKKPLFESALDLLQQGETKKAGRILVDLSRTQPDNPKIWYWLSQCVDEIDDKISYLERANSLDPYNLEIRDEIKWLIAQKLLNEEGKKTSKRQGSKPAQAQSKPNKPEHLEKEQPETTTAQKPEQPPAPSYKIIVQKRDENTFNLERVETGSLTKAGSGMYGNRLIIGGIRITPYDFPSCIATGITRARGQCEVCEFFGEDECPLIDDPKVIHELRLFYASQVSYVHNYRRRRRQIRDIIHRELREHGRPLHYEIVARMVMSRYPQLNLTPKKIVGIMNATPELFERLDTGVFRARMRKTRARD